MSKPLGVVSRISMNLTEARLFRNVVDRDEHLEARANYALFVEMFPAAPITPGSVRVPHNPTNGESYATFSILLA